MILPSNRYRDPAEVYEREEERTCKGCKHWTKFLVFSEEKMICEKGKKRRSIKCYEEITGITCRGGK